MNKVQLKVNIDAETKQQVEAAAAEKNISVEEYVLGAVQRQLADEGIVVEHRPSTRVESLQLVEEMNRLRESILAERNNEPIDINAIIDLVRDERDAELLNLR